MKHFEVINSTSIYLPESNQILVTETFKMAFLDFLERYKDYDIWVYSFDAEYVRAIVYKQDVKNLLLLSSN